MATDKYWITGVVREAGTERALADLVVRAYDKDLVFDDVLGFATTDEVGRFRIAFDSGVFQDWFESEPDLYLRVFDREGAHELFHTRDKLRRNAGQQEHFELEIPPERLTPGRS